jgi:hypothetical protein
MVPAIKSITNSNFDVQLYRYEELQQTATATTVNVKSMDDPN